MADLSAHAVAVHKKHFYKVPWILLKESSLSSSWSWKFFISFFNSISWSDQSSSISLSNSSELIQRLSMNKRAFETFPVVIFLSVTKYKFIIWIKIRNQIFFRVLVLTICQNDFEAFYLFFQIIFWKLRD
jgi:hypothetical protein